MIKVAILIPTCNEEIHIARCLSQLKFFPSVYILDTDSTDKTIDLIKSFNVNLIQHEKKFRSFAQKLNYGLEFLYKSYDWVFIIHADELITSSIKDLIKKLKKNKYKNYSAISVKRKLSFLGKVLNYGGNTTDQLRFFKANCAFYKDSEIDEKVELYGKNLKTSCEIIDYPLNNYSVWLDKHSVYSINQARKSKKLRFKKSNIGFIQNLYEKSPLFLRCVILFLFKYLICLGFLDGKSGLAYCVSHNLIYRLMVDVRLLTGDTKYQNNIKHKILE